MRMNSSLKALISSWTEQEQNFNPTVQPEKTRNGNKSQVK